MQVTVCLTGDNGLSWDMVFSGAAQEVVGVQAHVCVALPCSCSSALMLLVHSMQSVIEVLRSLLCILLANGSATLQQDAAGSSLVS